MSNIPLQASWNLRDNIHLPTLCPWQLRHSTQDAIHWNCDFPRELILFSDRCIACRCLTYLQTKMRLVIPTTNQPNLRCVSNQMFASLYIMQKQVTSLRAYE